MLILPPNITEIGYELFIVDYNNQGGLKPPVYGIIGENVRIVKKNAFENQIALKFIYLPKCVTIEEFAFGTC